MTERRQWMWRACIAALAGLSLLGCRDSAGEAELFRLDGRLFVFNYRVATASYLVNLVPVQPVDDGQSVVASFEDPAGGAPIVVRQRIWPKLPKTTIQSPAIFCVVKDRPYAVSIAIEGPDGQVRQTIDTTITSSLDQTVLPDRPLVVGPVYTKNPELAGRPSGKLPEGTGVACPPGK
jgi:hypothetical protein